jgi:hypothetical protein
MMPSALLNRVLTEGEAPRVLSFSFPSVASKYDAWSHYRNQFNSTCHGAKAVDFVFLETGANTTCWLIEVKDYRVHARTKPIDLADEIAIKVRDTLAGLLSAKWNANDEDERNYAARLAAASRVRVVCHLEQPAKTSRLRPRAIEPDKVVQKLKSLIKAIDPHPLVIDHRETAGKVTWIVAT